MIEKCFTVPSQTSLSIEENLFVSRIILHSSPSIKRRYDHSPLGPPGYAVGWLPYHPQRKVWPQSFGTIRIFCWLTSLPVEKPWMLPVIMLRWNGCARPSLRSTWLGELDPETFYAGIHRLIGLPNKCKASLLESKHIRQKTSWSLGLCCLLLHCASVFIRCISLFKKRWNTFLFTFCINFSFIQK